MDQFHLLNNMAILSAKDFFGDKPGSVIQNASSTPIVVPNKIQRRETFLGMKQGEESIPARAAARVGEITKEEVGKAGERFAGVMGKAEGPVEKGAAILTLPLRAAGTTARIFGKSIAEPLQKFAEFIGSPIVEKIEQAVPGFSEEVAANVGKITEVVSGKAEQIKQAVGEENYQSLADTAEVLSTFYGGKTVAAPVEKALQEGMEAGVRTGKELAESAARIAASGREMAEAGVRKVGEKVAEKGGGISESLVANINRINPSKRQQFQVQHGVSEERWLIERGIVGTRDKTVKELANRFQTIRQNVDEALEKIPGNYRDPRITTVADDAAAFAKSVESKQAGRMSQLAEKVKGEGLTTSEINEVKRFYERNIKTGYKKDPTKTAEQVQRATNRDSDIREALFDIADKNGFGNLRELNKEIQASKFLADEIAGKMQGQAANNMMTLTDWIVATPGVVDPAFFAGFVGKKLLSTETARAFAARALAGFPKVKPLPRADLDLITKKAGELLKKQADIKAQTEQAALLADELQKAGFTMSEGQRGFIMENPIPLSPNEQALIRAAKNRAEQQQMVQYLLEQRAQGKAVGKGFVIQNIDNVSILNPQERFDPYRLGPDIEYYAPR